MNRNTSPDVKSILNKIKAGDPLSDEEVLFGIEFFGDLSEKLELCGPEFLLAANEIRRVTFNLNCFKRARGLQ